MTVPSIIYAQYAPEQIKVDSLGIGLSDTSNEFMNLSMSQYMIVGQFETSRAEDPTGYNMIVDHEGVAIRTSIRDRQNQPNEYALYVDGDTYVTGRVITSNLVVLGGSSNGPSIYGEGFWNLATDSEGIADIDNLYYSGKVTLGNNFQAYSNTHTFNISRAADRSIDHAQINIENTQDAQLRLGIIGIGRTSPAIINTPRSTPLEFHVGRDQSYFSPLYRKPRYVTHVNSNTGVTTTTTLIEDVETPQYSNINDCPHLMIDENGNVGIRTSYIPEMEFDVRMRNPLRPSEINYYPTVDTPSFYVAKTSYASNILMWDHETASPKHLDELYVRRLGVTFRADQILPGYFAPGSYTFVSNVSIGGPPDDRYDLRIYNNARINSNLYIDGMAQANNIVVNDAIMLDTASFCNDVYMNRDVIVNQAMRIRGQLYVEALSNLSNGETISTWELIDFGAARPGYSNLNVMGTGISTPGRLGVGINPQGTWVSDEVNHQMTIVKRDAYGTTFANMFELELLDKSTTGVVRAAWIGHPQNAGSNAFRDGSLLFVTPSTIDGDYSPLYKQNMYFYPGEGMSGSSGLILRSDNPPTLGIFEGKRVGILTYDPKSELDVRGDITFTGDLKFYNTNTDQTFNLGLWKSQEFARPLDADGTPPTYFGLQYYNTAAPYVGVNALPHPKYGMNIAGGLRSLNGYFTESNRKIEPWYNGQDSNTTTNHVASSVPFSLYSYGNVGIGVKTPSANLEIKDNYSSANGTTLKLTRNDETTNPFVAIDMQGANEHWRVRTNDNTRTFEIANAASFSNSSNERMMWGRYNRQINRYQVVIGCNLGALNSAIANPSMPNNSTLTVGGDMSVLGDVNITGQFKVMSQNVTVEGETPPMPELRPDDVFIGGANIILTPSVNRGIFIGNFDNSVLTETTSLLRIYQNDSRYDTLATFKSTSDRALIHIENGLGKSVKFGVLDPTSSSTLNVPFAFLDGNDVPYLAFKSENDNMSSHVLVKLIRWQHHTSIRKGLDQTCYV
jgi:hypothetical protein